MDMDKDAEIERLRGVISALVTLLRLKTSDAEWEEAKSRYDKMINPEETQ
jgi:hypothetical protein